MLFFRQQSFIGRRFLMRKLQFLAGVAAIAVVATAQAQQVYRIIGPDGKVTFSDKPPQQPANTKVTSSRGGTVVETGDGVGLPLELRNVIQRYPVTLYTMPDCGPCDSGRSMLRTRGIPFAERTVSSAEDSAALRRLAGDTTMPILTIGSQQLKGYSDGEWTQYLDLAGYPKTSQLPGSYRNPAPSPLVARAAAPAAAPAAAAPATSAAPAAAPAPTTNPDNPAGIRF
jgi:glutaredoxin